VKKITEAVWKTLLPRSPVFTTRDAAEAADVAIDVASRDLAKLARRGMIARLTRGIWADVKHPDFSPYAAVPYLLRARDHNAVGYVSLLSAMSLHGMIEQIPRVIQVVADKQRPRLKTAIGTYEFHKIQPELLGGYIPYGMIGSFDVATPAKALFDTLYLSARRGRRFSHLPEVTLTKGFSAAELEEWIHRTEFQKLRLAVAARWQHLRATIERRESREDVA
jgi:predicted transcriptional regulator of viral defense system